MFKFKAKKFICDIQKNFNIERFLDIYSFNGNEFDYICEKLASIQFNTSLTYVDFMVELSNKLYIKDYTNVLIKNTCLQLDTKLQNNYYFHSPMKIKYIIS